MERLKILRKEQAYTQQQMADMLGIQRTTYTKYENGTIVPNAEMLAIIAKVLDCSTDYLLGRSDEREKPTVQNDGQPEEKIDQALVHVLMSLSPEDRKMMLDLAERLKTARGEKSSL